MEEEEEEQVPSSSAPPASSSVPSVTHVPRSKEEEEEEEELAALQKAMKKSLEEDLDRHLAEAEKERQAAAAARAEEEEEEQALAKLEEEEEEEDMGMLSSLVRVVGYLLTLLWDLVCEITEDLFEICLPAFFSFTFALLGLVKRGEWKGVGDLLWRQLRSLLSYLNPLPLDLIHFVSRFPFLPFPALMGLDLLLGCYIWYWFLLLQLEQEGAAADVAAAAAAEAARTVKVSDMGESLGEALVELATYTKALISG